MVLHLRQECLNFLFSFSLDPQEKVTEIRNSSDTICHFSSVPFFTPFTAVLTCNHKAIRHCWWQWSAMMHGSHTHFSPRLLHTFAFSVLLLSIYRAGVRQVLRRGEPLSELFVIFQWAKISAEQLLSGEGCISWRRCTLDRQPPQPALVTCGQLK